MNLLSHATTHSAPYLLETRTSGDVDTIQHLMPGALSCSLFLFPEHCCQHTLSRFSWNLFCIICLLHLFVCSVSCFDGDRSVVLLPNQNKNVRNPVGAKNLEEAKYDAQMWRKTSPGGVHCDSQIGSKSYSPEPTVAQDPRFPHNFSF